ncbi:MAG: inositol monophosphatase family protein [Xanthomonadales bacterium]|nr:inositol monophosphatase family protein [Xanthomonadales bacterium]
MSDLEHARDVAIAAADAASTVIMRYFRGDFDVELKADQTPVTIADRMAEDVIRATLLSAFPEHAIHGEERGISHGTGESKSDYTWLVDPIDGTKCFVKGYGMFSCQIALMHRGQLVLGVSTAPAMGEQAVAVDGQGTRLDGKRVQVGRVENIEDAAISTGNIGSLAASDRWPALGNIMAAANTTRGYGDFYHYHRLAAGQLDAVIESDLNILDIAALTVVVREAGGVVTDLFGAAVGMDTTSILAANPTLHAKLLAALQS